MSDKPAANNSSNCFLEWNNRIDNILEVDNTFHYIHPYDGGGDHDDGDGDRGGGDAHGGHGAPYPLRL